MPVNKYALTRLKINFPTNFSLSNHTPTHKNIYMCIFTQVFLYLHEKFLIISLSEDVDLTF